MCILVLFQGVCMYVCAVNFRMTVASSWFRCNCVHVLPREQHLYVNLVPSLCICAYYRSV